MILSQIQKLLSAELICESGKHSVNIESAEASDLMSDVLAFSPPFSGRNTMLITGLTNKQVIRTCEIAGVTAIVFVRGKRPTCETIALARQCGIPLLTTELTMFEACGILYSSGLRAAAS